MFADDHLNWKTDGADWPHREASQFVSAAHLRWHIQRFVGPPGAPILVLVHGTGAATHSWRALAPLLAQHFTVIAPDLPGHGFTHAPAFHDLSLPGMAADLSQLLRKMEVVPDIVVGHSAGAAILARMSLDGRIAPRVIVSLNGAFMPFGGLAGHLFSPLAKLFALNPFVPRLFAWKAGDPAAVERLLRDTGSAIDPEGVALYRKLVRNPAHVAAALRMMANWNLEPLVRDLRKLKPRLHLVTADRDRSIAPEVAYRVRDILPAAIVERVPGLGHLAHEERPELIAALIVRVAEAAAEMPESISGS